MENDRESRKLLLDLVENVECEWRWNETAGLRVSCALLRLELVGSVRGTDGDGERIAASTCGEVDDLLRLCVVRLLSGNLILNAGENAKLGLNGLREDFRG